MQILPFKPTLKPLDIKRLKPQSGWTGFNFCFQIQLAALHRGGGGACRGGERGAGGARCGAGRGLHSSTSQLNLSRFSHSEHPLGAKVPPTLPP